jgi:small subunit ribosomal protein S19
MSRSKRKNNFCLPLFFKSKFVSVIKESSLKIYSRSLRIPKEFIGNSVLVYNGKRFVNLKIVLNNSGYKFGEFSTTRIPFVHKRKKQKKNKNILKSKKSKPNKK